MKIIYNLVKKDFILIKRYLLIMLLFVIVSPIFISTRTPEFQSNGTVLYGILVLLITFMTYHMISMEEMKHKAVIYLHITPMSNKKMVLSKYIVVTFTFLVTTIVYCTLTLIPFTKVGEVDIKSIMICFVCIELFFGFYITLTFKLGYVKLQMISAGIIFLSPFIIQLLSKQVSLFNYIATSVQSLSNWVIIVSTMLLDILIVFIGTNASNSFLKKQEY
ncbi:ABC-2 transporter permease [Abyssisolibacter fermentans]|uniref:ABC-2 transporter permease n=1 Tax=Abyssisolibacter fermentans TaxID=1766203 RepID=UPI0008300C9E|nr:ABC-2 transporter permease [Abyssisolibacter fermentans]